MLQKKLLVFLSLTAICFVFFNARTVNPTPTNLNNEKIFLGKQIFFDEGLSNPVGQSCASCHRPDAGFSDPSHLATSAGVVSNRFGSRNSPTITYSSYTPVFHYNTNDSVFAGGLFLDGRANSLADQARQPFLNNIEMNNTNEAQVVQKLQQAKYYRLFKKVYGEVVNPEKAFANVTDAIARFEQSSLVNPFSSKFDFYLKGMEALNEQEMRGLKLFNDPKKGNCASCHSSTPDPVSGKVLFTDFTYDNIGVPSYTSKPTAAAGIAGKSKLKDYGLGARLNKASLYGSFKVPGLRNVALSYPYFHNGSFGTLEDVVHFYNKRDVEPYTATDFPATVNHDELGNLHLNKQEEKEIVAFLKTLTDGYKRW